MVKTFSGSICFLAVLLCMTTVNGHAGPNATSNVQVSIQKGGQALVPGSNQHLLHGVKKKPYVEGEVIVTLRPEAEIQSSNSSFGRTSLNVKRVLKQTFRNKEKQCLLIKSKDGNTTQEMIAELKQNPEVMTAEPNYYVSASATLPNDPDFEELWGLYNLGQSVDGITGTSGADISAPDAWDLNQGSSDVVVAVLDTGVLYTHPDLVNNMWRNPGETVNGLDNDNNSIVDDIYGIDTANGDSDPIDDNGHGTHCAGTIGASGDDGYGITGVNWNVKIMAVKALDSAGSGTSAAIIEGINYIVKMKRDFEINIVAINASYGWLDVDATGGSSAEQEAIESAQDAGILFVAAAGNEANDNDGVAKAYPASYPVDNIISVAATDQDDALTYFSNYGATTVDLAAPGNNIYSTCITNLVDEFFIFDDFENEGRSWNRGGKNAEWTIASTDNDTTVLKTNSAAEYQSYAYSYLANTKTINLSNTTNPRIEFWIKGHIEQDSWEKYDKLWIMINGGRSWEELGFITGLISDWTLIQVPIPLQFRKRSVRVGFILETDFNVTYEGYSIDDFVVGDYSAEPSYDYKNGTSMAAPHVTGAVALLAAQLPGSDIVQRKANILSTVDSLGSLAGLVSTGGRLNLEQAINIECEENADCDDGLFCNGYEMCTAGDCVSGSAPCEEKGPCYELLDQCCPEWDLDGDCDVDIKDGRALLRRQKVEKKALLNKQEAEKKGIRTAIPLTLGCDAFWDLNSDCNVDSDDGDLLLARQEAERTALSNKQEAERIAARAAILAAR